jgi:hypothetical protein
MFLENAGNLPTRLREVIRQKTTIKIFTGAKTFNLMVFEVDIQEL